jgi:iron complex outermembrane receptor protein
VTLDQRGVFGEGVYTIGASDQLRFGLRGDRHRASADAAHLPPDGSNPSPRELWRSYYGQVDERWDRFELGGFVRYEHHTSQPGTRLFVALSRTARSADTTQRYMAANSGNPGLRWVGNPMLEAATHVQLDAGASRSGRNHSLSLTAFVDDVRDEILRDRAHGQPGVLRDDGATIYRNIDALRWGAEIAGQLRIVPQLTLGGDAAFVRAENTTDGRAVAQTPPLEGQAYAAFASGRWGATAVLRWAARQTRVDDDPTLGSGLDTGQTPGWAAVDLSGVLELGGAFVISAGVENIFDRSYAYHLNRSSFFEPLRVRVNEPGRVLWVRLGWSGRG